MWVIQGIRQLIWIHYLTSWLDLVKYCIPLSLSLWIEKLLQNRLRWPPCDLTLKMGEQKERNTKVMWEKISQCTNRNACTLVYFCSFRIEYTFFGISVLHVNFFHFQRIPMKQGASNGGFYIPLLFSTNGNWPSSCCTCQI